MKNDDLESLLALINDELPREEWKPWPGGWINQIEAALIDAVLSIQASYGSEINGVRAAVARYKGAVSDKAPNNLDRLARYDAEQLQELLNDQLTNGRTKASAIVEAAQCLVEQGVHAAEDLDPKHEDQKRAYTSVHGLGRVTWDYFGMLLGKPGVKADTWIVRFVERSVGRNVDSGEARSLVMAAAEHLKASPTELDHAVWAHERNRHPDEN